MPNHKGSNGIVQINGDTVAELTSYSIEESADTIEDTILIDTAKTFISDLTSWTASIECFWDETDSAGQGAMRIGATVNPTFYPEGVDDGDTAFTGTAIVTSVSKSASIASMITQSFSLQGSGPLLQFTESVAG